MFTFLRTQDSFCCYSDNLLKLAPLLRAVFSTWCTGLEFLIKCFLKPVVMVGVSQSGHVNGDLMILGCLHCVGPMCSLRIDLTNLWFVQHSAPCMALVILMSWISLSLTITKSIRSYCLDLGCIQVVLYLSTWWKMVFVMHSMCSAHLLSRSRPVLFRFPTKWGLEHLSSHCWLCQHWHWNPPRLWACHWDCCLYEVTKVLIELLFGFIWAGEGGGISTDDVYVMSPVQWELQLHEALIDSNW